MEQSRKRLKITSLIVLLFAGLTLLNVVSELLLGDLNEVAIPDGAPTNILLITKIVVFVVSLLLLLPQVYIGFKGIKIAKHPDASRGHITWGIILLIFSILGLISPIIAVINQETVFSNVSALLSILVEILVFFDYIQCARSVRVGK